VKRAGQVQPPSRRATPRLSRLERVDDMDHVIITVPRQVRSHESTNSVVVPRQGLVTRLVRHSMQGVYCSYEDVVGMDRSFASGKWSPWYRDIPK
jgi:hypothetical protein